MFPPRALGRPRPPRPALCSALPGSTGCTGSYGEHGGGPRRAHSRSGGDRGLAWRSLALQRQPLLWAGPCRRPHSRAESPMWFEGLCQPGPRGAAGPVQLLGLGLCAVSFRKLMQSGMETQAYFGAEYLQNPAAPSARWVRRCLPCLGSGPSSESALWPVRCHRPRGASRTWLPANHLGEQDGVRVSWLQSGPALAVVGI